MPQPFNNAVMTRDGATLLTRAQAGEIKIKFTRIAIGNGIYSVDEKTFSMLQEQKELKSPKNSYPLSHIEVYTEHSVKITALITNKDLITGETLIHEGYFINEMGLFAKPEDGNDDTEVLYSITVTSGENGDFMPPYNGYNPAQITQDYFATVSNNSEVTINFVGAALSAEQVEAKLSKKADLDANKKIPVEQIPAVETKDNTVTFSQATTRENIISGEKHSTIFGKIAKFFADLKTVAFTGSYNDLKDKPTTFPPSSHKHTKSDITNFPSSMPASDVPSWAKASSKPSYSWNEIGSKPSSMPASDVYSWAKASSKPSYSWNEIGSKPSSFNPSSHSHSWDSITGKPGSFNPSNHNHDSSYLKLSGGTMTGTLKIGNIDGPDANNAKRVYMSSVEAGRVALLPVSGEDFSSFVGVRIGFTSSNTLNYQCIKLIQHVDGIDIMPTTNKCNAIGNNSTMFACMGAVNFYNSSGTITSSDRNKKMNFEEITLDFAEKIVEGLKPTSYMYKEGTSGRRHYGLVAQDVEELLEELGISTEAFAPLVKTWPTKTIMHKTLDENGNEIEIGEKVTDYDAEPEYYLRYEGFTGIIIKYIQGLKNENRQQQAKIEDLEKRLAKLEKGVLQQTA